jgi:hypothetical protein
MSPRERAQKLLQTVAEESEGRVFLPESEEELILKTTPQVITELRKKTP